MRDPWDLAGRRAVVATMHGKTAVIAPVLAPLGLTCVTCQGLDTDRFGTFTRDIARSGSQTDALLAKARAALDLDPTADFALASEGAFGPHPLLPLIPSGLELVALVERHSGCAVIGRDHAVDAHFAQGEAQSADQVAQFVSRSTRAGHGWVVMAGRDGPVLARDIADADALHERAMAQIARSGSVWLETDMRAHRNPTRMAAIGRATRDLVRRLTARCPHCNWPDWIGQTEPGRRCAWCDMPTHEPLGETRKCRQCGRCETVIDDPDRRAEPANCPQCNP
jgi:hypothetical protein